MGLKPQGTTSDLNNGTARGNASVQGLVGQNLSGGDAGDLTDPSNSSIVLPYLNETWSKNNSDVVKYYNADSNGAGVINFPFYEVTAPASGNVGSSSAILGTYNGNYYGTGTSTAQYARFYQFDSSESNLYFNIKDNDPTKKQGYLSETNTQIYSNIPDSSNHYTNYGFFPFNSSTSSYGKANNRGFGAKYQMQFKLKNDGCVGVVDSSGNDLDPSEYKTRIDTIFEFVGDDDLWVFVDGKLVLDMGGAHNKSIGSINFKTKTATVKRAVSIGSSDTDKDDLDVTPANTPVDITTILQTANNKTFVDNDPSKGYNENTTHTMTIFYMERGMNDSNLKIRFNYSPEANFSKMKIAEVTDFSSVNDGLQSYTKIAAENDVFKYTVSNKNTSKSDIYNSSAKYPTAEARTRSNEADSSLQTKLVNGGTNPNIYNFNPPGTLNNATGIWSKVDTFKLVSGTSYLWVDGFANNKKMVGITTGSNASNATGDSDSGGELYLMYGTNNDLYNANAEGKESSAEFEKQFSKDSTMLVLQDSNLYSPKRMDGDTPVTPGLISNQNGALFSALTSSGRATANYYNTTVRVVDRDYAENKSLVNDSVNDYANNILNNGGQFTFSNDPSGSSADLPVMLTEYFKNTVNVGSISISKTVTNETSNQDYFKFQLTLSGVFGTSVNVPRSGYGSVAITGAFHPSDGSNAETLDDDGYFYVRPGTTAVISGIPYDTDYSIQEIADDIYSQTGTTGDPLIGDMTGAATINKSSTVVNARLTGDLILKKQKGQYWNENGIPNDRQFEFTVTLTKPNSISFADFINYFSDISNYTQNSTAGTLTRKFNISSETAEADRKITGIPRNTTYSVTETDTGGSDSQTESNTSGTISTSSVTATITNNYAEVTETPVTVKKNGNTGDNMSGAEFELWYKETIPPQTNSFNEPKTIPNQLNNMKVTASPAEVGVPAPEVPASVTNYTVTTTYENPSVPNASDTEWILPRNDTDYIYFRDYNTGTTGWEDKPSYTQSATGFATVNNEERRTWRATNFVHHNDHNQDLKLSYDESYWFAAEFSGTGKITRRYSMWERFVDVYNDTENNTTPTTTVWKIQPPDGYTTVRFMLMQGDTCVRKTEAINYQLGKIYHKTSWGGYYTTKDGKKCYYDVPYIDEGYWAPNDGGEPYDKRDGNAGTMKQARKYEPTAQKVIFHCDSTKVWHNIHIEFFTTQNNGSTPVVENSTSYYPVNGQAFPGYMMEPYAYAGNDYRVGNYLTYELTIPANATHFRVNNGEAATTYHGETAGTYSYGSAITELKTATTGSGKKNYNNYWEIDSESYPTVTLKTWSSNPEGTPNLDYKNAEVSSDYDYIYFNTAGTTWDKVYAYFYAGGDLRGDNWQRACYSSWPGVAAAGTEYGTVHSNTYTDHTTGDQYNGTTTGGTLSPVATYNNGTIYKFRIPKGDHKNYSKVIFNNGLNGGDETSVIDYQPGHIYNKNGNATMHYENSPTTLYTARTNSEFSGTDKKEYIYVKNTAGWDDLHVTFYDANGGQILQGGKGYVMNYAGSSGEYFKIPIPTDAVKFSVNNGIGNDTEVSPKADIIRLNGTAGDDDNGKTKTESDKASTDRFVYELAGSAGAYTLTRLGFTTTSTAQESRPAPQEEGFSGYTPVSPATEPPTYTVRQHGTSPNTVEHTLNIRDMANWNVDIGRISVTFYDANGTQIGPNVMVKTVADSQGKVWYTKKIHPNAKSFTVSYSTASGDNPPTYTTPKYPIYAYAASDPGNGTDYTTSGSMFFDTAGSGANSTLVMTHEEPVNANNAIDDETYSQRGDYLYLITDSVTVPDITFYASGTNVIKSGIKGKYINHDSEGYWYKVSIPTGAQSFFATGMGSAQPIYELRSKFSPYKKDYTLGDMQYKISGGSTTLVYPVFTADTYNTLDVYKDGGVTKQISSNTAILVDESAVADYAGAAKTLPAATSGDYSTPTKEILYNTVTTDQDNITYSWTEGTAADDKLRFVKPSDWSAPTQAKYYSGTMLVETKTFSLDTGSIYKVDVPTAAYDSVVITDGTRSTSTIGLTNYNGGKNYKITRNVSTGTYSDDKVRFDNSTTQWSDVYVHFWNGDTESGTWYSMSDSDGDNIFEYTVPSGTYDHVRFSKDQSATSSNPKTLALSRSNGGKNAIFTPSIVSSNIYFRVGSTPWGVWSSQIYAYYYSPGEYHAWGDNCPEHKKDDEKRIHFEIGNVNNKGTYTKLIVYGYNNGTKWQSVDIDVSGTPVNGGGRIYRILNDTDSSGHYNVEFLGYGDDPESSGTWYTSGTVTTWPLTSYNNSTQTTLTYAYQPEDRYGMISDDNTSPAGVLGKADVNDFIKVVLPSSVATPYIKFYSDTSGTIEINSGTSTKGLLLKPNNGGGSSDNNMTLNGTTYTPETATTNTYMVRLPKDAGSFEILNGETHVFTQSLKETGVQTVMTALDENNQPISQTVTVPGTFYHAGTTFDFTGETVTKTLRTGFTPYKQSSMVDPLDPMTDNDFVYFTDTNGFANGGKVFAYFYGGADGEYKSWPGSYAVTPTPASKADTTYKDNNGNTVYKFRVPKDSDGNYTKVIFNNGQSGSNLKITAAQDIVGGRNYVLGAADNTQDYGTMTSAGKVFTVSNAAATDKSSTPTATYSNSANKTIYFINNGTNCSVNDDLTGERYVLDDIHVEFFADDGSTPVGTADPGYIPEKVGSYNQGGISGDVYRIVAPNNAKFFRINNGTGKGAVSGSSTHNHDRKSEIKLISNNGLYSFVTDETKYTKDGTQPSTIQALSQPEYLLQLVNPREVDEDEQSDAEHFDVKLATVRTNSNGDVDTILWLKDSLNSIDHNYIANDDATAPVKVVKNGEYYWKEVTPPSGYKLPDTTIQTFTLPTTDSTTTTFTDPKNDTGSLTIKKKLYSVDGEDPAVEKTKLFKFTIELNAPVGTQWGTNVDTTVTLSSTSTGGEVRTPPVTNGLNRVITVVLPADGTTYATVSGIPYGTTYSVTEQPIKIVEGADVPDTDYTSEPITIYKPYDQTSTTVVEAAGEIKSSESAPSYLLVNKREVGSLNLKDIVVDHGVNALVHADVNQPKTHTPPYDPPIYDWYKYNYKVTLIAPEGVDLNDYITKAQLDAITGIGQSTNVQYTNRTASAPSQYEFYIHVTSAPDGMRTISNIPLGTRYIVTEEYPTDTYETDKGGTTNTDANKKANVSWQKSGEVPSTATAQYVNAANRSPTVTIKNEYWYEPVFQMTKVRTVSDSNSTLPALTPSGGTKVEGLDYFVYTVKLTAPDDKLWNDSDFSGVTGIPNGVDKVHNEIAFTVNADADDATGYLIKGLPARATYTVTESTANNANPTPDGYKCVSDSPKTGTVSEDGNLVAITNTYTQLGSLTITKSLTGGSAPTTGTYTVTGSLTNSALDLGTTYRPTPGSGVTFGTYHSDTHTLDFTAQIQVTSGGTASVEITDIPYGTTYSLSENDTTDSSTPTYSSTHGTDVTENSVVTGHTGTVNSTAPNDTVTITNDYPTTGTLTLTKSITGVRPSNVPNSNYEYILTGTITTYGAMRS